MMTMRIRLACLLLIIVGTAYQLHADEAEETVDSLIAQIYEMSSKLPEHSRVADPRLSKLAALYEQNRLEELVIESREIIRADPANLPARYYAATALISLRRYEAARTLLEQLLELHPQHPALLNNLAWLYAAATDPAIRQPQRALELARRAVVIEPNSFHIWNTLSEAYFVNRDFERALRAAEEALRLAEQQKAPADLIAKYINHAEKCKEALTAYSIFE